MNRIYKWTFEADTIETVLGSILRTPGIILLDYWHQKCLDFSVPKSLDLDDMADASLHLTVLLLGIVILLLPYEHLIQLYMHLIAASLLVLEDIMSRVYVEEEVSISDSASKSKLLGSSSYKQRQFCQIASCLSISVFNAWCLNFKSPWMIWFPSLYLIPVWVRMMDYPVDLLPLSLNVSSLAVLLFVIFYWLYLAPTLFKYGQEALLTWQLMTSLYGNGQGIVLAMGRLFDPVLFVLYWIALFLAQLWTEHAKFQAKAQEVGDWTIMILLVVSEICNSPLTLIALCLTVMTLSKVIISCTNAYLTSCKSHAPPNTALSSGLTEGLVMFLLSLQTGLIDMTLPQRLGAMSIILFIVAASLFQTVLEITHPVLLSLSASSRNVWSHLKVLALCLILCVIPAHMSYLLISTVDLDLWTMVVISSSLLTSIQVVGHLVHYCLYLYDSFRSETMESIDDYVYYLKSMVHASELISALFVVCAGLKEAATGHWSFINSVVLMVHCYFNVWVRIKSGWRSFLLRQAAVNRIQTLVDATEAELRIHNDVCAICYSDMLTAKVTPCGHYFHGGCLKKWLFVQDHCPMCSAKIIEGSGGAQQEVVEEEEFLIDANEQF